MTLVTLLWSINATVAVILAILCAVACLAERRDFSNAFLCVTALGTAACAPTELGMMHAATPAEYGEWLRWHHVPIFFTLVAMLLFVRVYLGTGRLWLLWTIIGARTFVLIANFSVDPNYHFDEIRTLDRIAFLGDQVSVVGQSVPRSWQWVAAASMLLIFIFLIDAALTRWRKGGSGSRRRALMVTLPITTPLLLSTASSQLVVAGILHMPVTSMLWFLGTIVIMSCELGREFLGVRRVRVQLVELRGELAQLERVGMLGQLATGLAHELAQPLSAIRVNMEAAGRMLDGKTPAMEELREIVADVQKDSTRAAEVIDHLRVLLKRGTVEAQPLALHAVVSDVVALLRFEAASRGVVLANNVRVGLPRVLGDRVHIAQVLLNLLGNAVDAVQSSPVGRRHVVVDAHVTPNGGIETLVKDSGPGIPHEQLETIFAPHYTTKSDGLGMGLALSRKIVEAHGGCLWAKNEDDGVGATFCFTLPLA